MSIAFVRKQDIDTTLWDQAVAQSAKGLPYACSWYLEVASGGKWHGLVAGNYERVMPLVWNDKLLGIKQLYQPVLTQQLGVFGREVSPEHTAAFLQAIPLAYRYVHLNLNFELTQPQAVEGHFRTRTNLIIRLDQPYEAIRKAYSRSLKRRLEQAGQEHRLERSEAVDQVVAFYRRELGHKVTLPLKSYARIEKLLGEALQRCCGELYEVRDRSGRIRCMGFFLKTEKRIINVFGASDLKGKTAHAMHFLLDEVLKKHAGTGKVFDFEGSDIKGVADFFRSFGSIEENYTEYRRDRLPWWLKQVRDLRRR